MQGLDPMRVRRIRPYVGRPGTAIGLRPCFDAAVDPSGGGRARFHLGVRLEDITPDCQTLEQRRSADPLPDCVEIAATRQGRAWKEGMWHAS